MAAADPDLALLKRWQMGRVFRVALVSPDGHLGLPEEDVEGNRQPSSAHPGFLHPSLVEVVEAGTAGST